MGKVAGKVVGKVVDINGYKSLFAANMGWIYDIRLHLPFSGRDGNLEGNLEFLRWEYYLSNINNPCHAESIKVPWWLI